MAAELATRGKPQSDLLAEKSVLGAVLLDSSCLGDVRAILDASHFYHPAHSQIFEAMVALAQQHEPVDVVTLTQELTARRRYNAVGGMQYLGELADTTPSIANVESYARVVRHLANVREFDRCLAEARARLADGADLLSAQRLVSKGIEACVDPRRKGPRTYAEIAPEWLEEVETMMRTKKIRGVSSGIKDLDRALGGGYHNTHLVIVGARPGCGKSAHGLQACESAAAEGAVLAISLEMKGAELFGRSAKARGQVDGARVNLGTISSVEFDELCAACEALSRLPIAIDDSPNMTLIDVQTSALRLRAKHGKLALIMVDYVQLMRPAGKESTREQAIGEISRGLKQLAKELDVPVLLLAQLNRDLEKRPDKRPQLSDLRESGSLEQDADDVLFLYRDELYNKTTEDKGIAEFLIRKQRNGPTGSVRVKWDGRWTRFADLESSESDSGSYHEANHGHYSDGETEAFDG